MARRSAKTTTVERLTAQLFDGATAADPLADEVAEWLALSSRFRAFASEQADKIRKKLRHAADAETLRDVRAELRVAHLLLADRRMELAFEAYGTRQGGPDFTVTFRSTRRFNLEVTRLRGLPGAAIHGGPLVAKLRQLPPSTPNAVVIAVEGDSAEALNIAGAARALRARADAKDDEFFVGRGLGGTRGFYERYLRLSAVLVLSEGAMGDARAALWVNRSARIRLPAQAGQACLDALRAG